VSIASHCALLHLFGLPLLPLSLTILPLLLLPPAVLIRCYAGVNPTRLLEGFSWPEFRWRRGELLDQLKGRAVLVGVDDMDVFKGIELKLQAFALLLEAHPEWRGNAVLVQVGPLGGAGTGLYDWKQGKGHVVTATRSLSRLCAEDAMLVLVYDHRCLAMPCLHVLMPRADVLSPQAQAAHCLCHTCWLHVWHATPDTHSPWRRLRRSPTRPGPVGRR
jgi:hypothetical protein